MATTTEQLIEAYRELSPSERADVDRYIAELTGRGPDTLRHSDETPVSPWDQPVDVQISFIEASHVVGGLRSSRETYEKAGEVESVEEIDAVIERLVARFELPLRKSWV